MLFEQRSGKSRKLLPAPVPVLTELADALDDEYALIHLVDRCIRACRCMLLEFRAETVKGSLAGLEKQNSGNEKAGEHCYPGAEALANEERKGMRPLFSHRLL